MPDDVYTHGHHESVLRSHTARTVENSAAYLVPHLAPGQAVLDIGCGPGTITAGLAAIVAPGRVLGIDRSEEVLENARAMSGLPRNVRFAAGDAYALDDAFAWAPRDPLLERWLDLYRAVAASNGAEPDAGRHLKGWAMRAGFDDVRAGASVWCFTEPAERGWWAQLWADRMRSSAVADQALDRGMTTREELSAIGEAFLRWADADDGWFLVPHGEVIARTQ